MNYPRIIIAGTASGVGKTTIAVGLMAAFKRRGLKIQGYKVGPDYLDIQYHKLATGRAGRNLDSYFMMPEHLVWAFREGAAGADLSIIEGVRGLYDGLTATGSIGSTASIAKTLNTPVILILNAKSLAKSAAAVILGFKQLDPTINIVGVIINYISSDRHRNKVSSAIQAYTKLPVIGALKNLEDLKFEQIHLGLKPLFPSQLSETLIDHLGRIIEENIELDQILEYAENTPPLTAKSKPNRIVDPELKSQKITVGIPYDQCFNFYYTENLEALQANGAELKFFSPINNKYTPNTDCYYIGGGYPELYPHLINQNFDFLEQINNATQNHKPIYAECGGMMVLSRELILNKSFKMANIFPFSIKMTKTRVGPHYILAKSTQYNPLFIDKHPVKGHEFHYSKIINPPDRNFAFKIIRGKGINGFYDGVIKNKVIATYFHVHTAGVPEWASNFLKSASL